MPTGLGYDFLRPVETRGSNDLKHYFMADLADGNRWPGKPLIASVSTWLPPTASSPGLHHQTVALAATFRFECGLLTMGEQTAGVAVRHRLGAGIACAVRARWTSWRMTT